MTSRYSLLSLHTFQFLPACSHFHASWWHLLILGVLVLKGFCCASYQKVFSKTTGGELQGIYWFCSGLDYWDPTTGRVSQWSSILVTLLLILKPSKSETATGHFLGWSAGRSRPWIYPVGLTSQLLWANHPAVWWISEWQLHLPEKHQRLFSEDNIYTMLGLADLTHYPWLSDKSQNSLEINWDWLQLPLQSWRI